MTEAERPEQAKASSPFLRATGVVKRYSIGKRVLEVLRGVDFKLGEGEFVALLGASGAGKSTLLHLLGGLDRPNKGEIELKGSPLSRMTESQLAVFRNRKVGFVFQSYHLLPELTALENVALPGRMARRPAGECEARARKLLRQVGLQEREEHRPYELSGGEQQRVSIARALINDPELLLADEPTGNLDSHTGDDIMNLLCNLWRDRRMTMLMATHDGSVAARAPQQVQVVDGLLVGARARFE